MTPPQKLAVEIWSPLPPQESGVADYVQEQLEILDRSLDLTLVVESAKGTEEGLHKDYRVIPPAQSDPTKLRVYHVGNSPLHAFIYDEAIKVPGVVVLHEWNLHELLLGKAVASQNFDAYRGRMRREHGERGSIAAGAIATALGGRHWTGAFPLTGEILQRALAVVCLSGATATSVRARRPGGRLLHLPHHALLQSNAATRSEARNLLGLEDGARVVLLPGLGTAAKSFDVARAAVDWIRPRVQNVLLVTVGGSSVAGGSVAGGVEENKGAAPKWVRPLGRVDLLTLGDALLAADVVLALRFPSRGEASGVLMRALAAGRASIVSAGSTADEDLPEGVVGRVNPGPRECLELGGLLEFLLQGDDARLRMERLARAMAQTRCLEPLTETLAGFLQDVSKERGELESDLERKMAQAAGVRPLFRDDLEAAASSLGLAHLPANVFEKMSGL